LAKATGLDVVAYPDRVNDPRHFMVGGVADFINCGCLPLAKADDVLGVTRRLNGGTVGLNERRAWLAKWKAAIGSVPPIVVLPPAPKSPPPDVPKPPPIVNPSKGSVGAFIASILSAIFRRK
jgi:putative chitinase